MTWFYFKMGLDFNHFSACEKSINFYCAGYMFWYSRLFDSPGQESQKIFNANFPIDTEASKVKVSWTVSKYFTTFVSCNLFTKNSFFPLYYSARSLRIRPCAHSEWNLPFCLKRQFLFFQTLPRNSPFFICQSNTFQVVKTCLI